ncbi:MAG TPA: amino acid ABC transporter substrate-binding protein [Ruminococcaceae bacterium]|nr:amino acid ABC transporter substrate-binding protein [Oscillospiraceae bacterium]
MKKFMATVLAASMLTACLASCGEGGKSDTFFIGGTGPLTGGAASYGISVKNGATLAIEEINKAGGLNGYQFKFDLKDDEADSEKAGTAYDQLMDEGMQISIGSVTSGSCLAFADRAKADNLFFMTPSASTAKVVEGKYAFRVCFGDPDQGYLAAETLAAQFNNIGVIYDTSDDYSSGIFAAFEEKMKELNKTYTARVFDSESKRDFSTQVAALKDCDVIFLPIYYTEAGLIAQEAKKIGCNAVLFGCDGLDGVADQVKGKDITNDIKYITPFDVNSTDEKVVTFVKAYKEKYNAAPDQFAADGYDAVMAIFEAMKKADVKDPSISAADLAEVVYKAITDGFTYNGVTGSMTWNKGGEPNKVPVIVDVTK